MFTEHTIPRQINVCVQEHSQLLTSCPEPPMLSSAWCSGTAAAPASGRILALHHNRVDLWATGAAAHPQVGLGSRLNECLGRHATIHCGPTAVCDHRLNPCTIVALHDPAQVYHVILLQMTQAHAFFCAAGLVRKCAMHETAA